MLEANAYDEANEEFIINEDMIVPYGDGVDEWCERKGKYSIISVFINHFYFV